MYSKLKELFETDIDLLDAKDFSRFYSVIDISMSLTAVADVTCVFFDADINPLDFMTVIPDEYMYSIQKSHYFNEQIKHKIAPGGTFKIPDNITRVCDQSLCCVDFITRLVIPQSVKHIQFGAFGGMKNLKEIVYEGTYDQYVSGIEKDPDAFMYTDIPKMIFSDKQIDLT